jgi:hypothetical protein
MSSPSAQTYYGINIAWGLGQTTYSVTNATGIFNSSDHTETAEEATVRDQRGNVVEATFYNPTGEATIEYIASDNAAAAGTAAITYPNQGTKVTVTADSADPINGTNWLVRNAVIRRINTDATKVTLSVIRYLAIS